MKEREKKELQAAQANRLNKIISELCISQAAFSKALDVTQPTINAVCTAKRSISKNLALLISEKYGINPQWLLYGEGQKYNENQTSQLQKANQLKQIASIRETIQQLTQQLDDLENEVRK